MVLRDCYDKSKSESAYDEKCQQKNSSKSSLPQYKWKFVLRIILIFLYIHISGLYGLYLILFVASVKTSLWTYFCVYVCCQGITCGAHRLWAHKTYKAKLPLRIILMILFTISFQGHIHGWVRNHRAHHKFVDSDADPHNSRRGFFFSHIGWLLIRKHPDLMSKGKCVDVSDMDADVVVMFQKRYYLPLALITGFFFPAFVPYYFWNEDAWVSWHTATMCRCLIVFHITFLVNSVAHIWGTKPYDKAICPVENPLVSLMTNGEGWHNYHHVFPSDYKAAELNHYLLNHSTMYIDFFAKIGWAYDLKTVSDEIIRKRAFRTGDGSRKITGIECKLYDLAHTDKDVCGWDDPDMKNENIQGENIFNHIDE